MIADAFATVFFNRSLLPSPSDFNPQSTDPTQHPQAPSSTVSRSTSTTVPPTAATPPPIDSVPPFTRTITHPAIIMAAVVTTGNQAKGKSPIRQTTPARPCNRSYSQALAATGLPLTPFGNATRAISEPLAGSSETYHST